MLSTLTTVWTTPGLRACAVAIFFFGFAGAATAPYQSVVAIRELGLSDAAFSAVTLMAAVINVLVSVILGTLADRDSGYRRLLMWLAACGILGFGAIYLVRSPWVFVFSVLIPLSVYGGLYSLLFAAGRVFSLGLPKSEQAAVSSVLRALISVAWILVPGLVGLALSRSETLLPAFLIAAIVALVVLVVIKLMMPRGGGGDASTRPPRVSLLVAFGLLLRLPVALRVLAAALITATLHVNGAVMPLIVTGQAGGVPGDVGVIVGLVAAIEVAFILVWARIVKTLSIVASLGLGVALYVVYLVWLAHAMSPAAVIAASCVGGVGAAAIITLPLGYLQELIADRPGLSSSLLSINMFLAGALAAGLFALGTAFGGYPTVAMMGAVAGAIGGIGLLMLEGWKIRAAV
ncbi:MFS transporter [Pseudoruegeria sp. HB172150]|uniref:MFS transporter n=1 Tax=Pseudoruegeria sp. HB172150 TaxID=2721164 RepID=UPI00155373E7|nr:MFS transporter [Pseudoruegeria sp. HB172150]